MNEGTRVEAACRRRNHTRRGAALAVLAAAVLWCGVPPAGAQPSYESIHKAAEKGSIEAVRAFLESGVHVDARDIWQRTPLHYAVPNSHTALVRLLLENGADANSRDKYGNRPLYDARTAEIGHLLLEHGAEIDARLESQETPLMFAVTHGEPRLVQLLIDRGADVHATDGEGFWPLLRAGGAGFDVVRALLDAGGDAKA